MNFYFFFFCFLLFLSHANSVFNPLLVKCEVNGKLLNAIIDTGAEVTVMSASCAKKCNIYSKINTEKKGKAIGIGSSLILGRTDKLSFRIGPLSFLNKISVLSSSRCDLLIGLDVLKRFNCEINLKENFIKFFVRGEEVRIPLDGSLRDRLNGVKHESLPEDNELDMKNLLTDYLDESYHEEQNEEFTEEFDEREEPRAIFSSSKYRSIVNAANRLINERTEEQSSQSNIKHSKALRVNHFHLDNSECSQKSTLKKSETRENNLVGHEKENEESLSLKNDNYFDDGEDEDFYFDPSISMEGV